jgi:hypothetical protein
MPRIEFRGKSYNNEFEMPEEIRRAYNKEKTRTEAKPLTEIVEMSPEVRAIYERALGNIDEKLVSPRPLTELPKTEDIYRQSAPDDMKHLPSDESIYRPSPPLIDSMQSMVEPEYVFRLDRFVLWLLILAAAVFLVTRFLL